ncbi:tetratricopeptide repeat protein [Magnetospirillum sulfuroxidans]|uniref:Tetratricopeptide repeat protein n=1 Tax=Magnetospirillum sulfuroxidans TaxID=611300 RepID=A0ABS5ICN8_9PROT|nr:hypothetical protein [Magnetospirillum sulfuroxidans]MBR9972094.1 hypothetical protein [Magnetospirillum sulfuroxidans]
MGRIVGSLLAIILLGTVMGCSPKPVERVDRQDSLDILFERLHVTTNTVEARVIEATIRQVWARSERAEVDKMMTQAIAALHAGAIDAAIGALDQVVVLAPDLVAGWNLRATAHYAQDDFSAALADIAMTLTLEPRHFGAWAGLGLIMLDLDRKQAALRAFETALRYNPHLPDVRDDVAALRGQLVGLPL